MTIEEQSMLKYELGNLEKIEKDYEALGLPQEHKQKFLGLLVDSIHNTLELKVEPWTEHNYEAWKTILKSYEECKNFKELKGKIKGLVENMRESEKDAERFEREERQRFEDR